MDTKKKTQVLGFISKSEDSPELNNAEDISDSISDKEKNKIYTELKELLLSDFIPVKKITEATVFATIEEIWEGMSNVIPRISIIQVRDALKECGFKITNLGEFDYKWMMRAKSEENPS